MQPTWLLLYLGNPQLTTLKENKRRENGFLQVALAKDHGLSRVKKKGNIIERGAKDKQWAL
jgi:hypothetical protein